MGYQTGTIGPISYHQDNSGEGSDVTTPINYRPEEFGAPAGSKVITATIQQSVRITRGKAYVENYSASPEDIAFDVYTQAAGSSWFIGWHSGCITVTTTFQWYLETPAALEGGEQFFFKEGPARPPK